MAETNDREYALSEFLHSIKVNGFEPRTAELPEKAKKGLRQSVEYLHDVRNFSSEAPQLFPKLLLTI